MRDRFGTPDPTPGVWTWTVDLSPVAAAAAPRRRRPTRTATASPDARDNCPAAANASQADADADGVGDACEIGAARATSPPVTGERVVVEVLSGEVFIKLPRASRSLQAGAAVRASCR